MECRRHAGQEAEFTCMECGQQFCRQCVQETRASHHCPACHQAELDRLASRLGVGEAKPKKEKPPREPVARKEKKALRKPREEPLGPPPMVSEPPPAPPPPSVTPEEKAAFWSDIEQPRRAGRRTEKEGAAPLRVEGLPPPPEEPVKAAGPVAPEPRVIPDREKRRILPADEREKAVLAAEGFPLKAEEEAEEARPGTARHAARPRKVRRRRGEGPVALQIPDDYDGEVTPEPSYLKAVLWSLLAGAVGAGAYAGVAWWRHREFGIIGWALGIAVGIALVLGSGRHFNWKIGLIAAGVSMFFISVGRIFLYMLTVWFPDINIKLPIGTIDNMKEAFLKFLQQIPTTWLFFFLITGTVAFLVSFRPWPIRLQMSSAAPARSTARKRA